MEVEAEAVGIAEEDLAHEEVSANNVDDPGESQVGEVRAKVDIVPFETLKDKINPNILKALIFKPFQLSAMSQVQQRVLKLMPYLVGGDYGEDTSNDASIAEVKEKGRQDLVVKAKTGTGKTLVRGLL